MSYRSINTGKEYKRLQEIIAKVNALPESFKDFQKQVDAVCAIFKDCGPGVWSEFDERSYSRCSERFGLVRQVRNHPDHWRALNAAVDPSFRKHLEATKRSAK